MKNFYIILLALLSITITQAQIVNIPDANFKSTLVNTPCVDTNNDDIADIDADTNDDGEIQESEAEAVISLIVSDAEISDLTGISFFINLEKLNCNSNTISGPDTFNGNASLKELKAANNSFSSMNLSNLTALEKVEISNNQIGSLDMSNNSMLEELSAGTNQLLSVDITSNIILKKLFVGNNDLPSLDISNNEQLTDLCIFRNEITTLTLPTSLNDLVLFEWGSNPLDFAELSIFSNVSSFWCDSTLITTLDLSGFNNLEVLVCFDNQITLLDVRNGNNANITLFDASSNTELDCIYVDNQDAVYLNDWIKDNASTFVNDESTCDNLSVEESEFQELINIYPNPAADVINLKSKTNLDSIIVFDVHGRQIFTKLSSQNQFQIDVSSLSKGVYFLNVKTGNRQQILKFIKE